MELRDEFTRRRVKRPRAQVEPPHAFEDWILTAHAHDHCVCICSSLLRRRAHLLVRLPVRHLTRFPAIPHARTPRTLELGVGCATHAHALILLLPSLVAHNFFIERHDERGGKRRRGLILGQPLRREQLGVVLEQDFQGLHLLPVRCRAAHPLGLTGDRAPTCLALGEPLAK